MNRRDLLKRAFAVGAAGLMLPVIEPVRKVWALDKTMVPQHPLVRKTTFGWDGEAVEAEWFDAIISPMTKKPLIEAELMRSIEEVWALVGEKPYNPKLYYSDAIIDRPELFVVGDVYRIGDERVTLESFNSATGFMRAVAAD